MQNTPQKCDLPIKKALADRKKVVKTGSIFMVEGMGKLEGHRQGQGFRAWARDKVMARLMGRGSAESKLRGMGMGKVKGHG